MKKRTLTRPGFAPALPDLPDPVCAKSCGRCHYCLRAKHGVDYWTKGVVE